MNTKVLNTKKSLGYFLLLIISFFLCTNIEYGMSYQYGIVYYKGCNNPFSCFCIGNHEAEETPIKIVKPEEKGKKIEKNKNNFSTYYIVIKGISTQDVTLFEVLQKISKQR